MHADIKGANILMGLRKGTENQAYLVDFGLATRVNEKEFKPDPKSAHNGTIEYTSRDAHLGGDYTKHCRLILLLLSSFFPKAFVGLYLYLRNQVLIERLHRRQCY